MLLKSTNTCFFGLFSRFTEPLADLGAKSILSVDFMENFVAKNKLTNGHHKNISFLQADVTELHLQPNRSQDKLKCYSELLSWVTCYALIM